MKVVTSTKLQRNFAALIPVPKEGFEITRDGIVIAYMFPADLSVNVATGVAIDVRPTSRYLGMCHNCSKHAALTKHFVVNRDKWLCRPCEDNIFQEKK